MADTPTWEEWSPSTLLPFGLDTAGRVQLSAAAMKMLGEPEAVILLYDREAGIIGINDPVPATPQCPFGGMKESGMGREGSKYGIEDYVEIKYVLLGGLGA